MMRAEGWGGSVAQRPVNRSAAPSIRSPPGVQADKHGHRPVDGIVETLSEETVAAVTKSILNFLRNAVRKLLRYRHSPRDVREAASPPLQPFDMEGIPNHIDSCMSHFLLTFGNPSQPPFAAAIIEAPSSSSLANGLHTRAYSRPNELHGRVTRSNSRPNGRHGRLIKNSTRLRGGATRSSSRRPVRRRTRPGRACKAAGGDRGEANVCRSHRT
jgi:hypothetical protein